MKLIDAETKLSDYIETWQCECCGYGTQTVIAVDDLQYLPIIDPVRAAGGCYCRECARCDGFRLDSAPGRVGVCHIDRRIVTPDGFCKWGKLKEAQNSGKENP